MSHTDAGARRARSMVLLLGVLLFLVPATRANAHAILLETDPGIDEVVAGSPTDITLRFTEPVEVAFGAIRVFDSRGERVDDGDARHVEGNNDRVAIGLEPDLPDGTYTVSWRVVSADSHPVSEAFVFHVGAPGPRPTGLAAAALEGAGGAGPLTGGLAGAFRWLNFGGLLVLAGGFAFLLIAWRGLGPAIVTRPIEMEVDFATRWRRAAFAAWLAVLAATVAGLVLQGAVAGGLSIAEAARPDVIGDVLSTRYGVVAGVKLGIMLAAGVLWVVLARIERLPIAALGKHEPASVGAAAVTASMPAWVVAVGAALLTALLATPGLAGHPAVTDPIAANIAADVVHVAAAAAWLGGLIVLLFAALPSARVVDESQRIRSLAPVVSRYSDLAMWSVAALVLSGTYRAFIEVGAWRGLTGTTYGKVLLIKLAAFLPLLALGAINNRVVKPRLRALATEQPAAGRPLGLLKRVLTVEVMLGAVVIAVTALLVNLAPGRVEAGIEGPFITDVAIGDMNVNILIDPNEVGENLVHVTATNPSGAPARKLRAAEVRFSMPEEDVGPLVGEGRKLGPGHYVVQGRQLSIAGEWTLEFVLRTGRFDEHTKKIEVTVNR